MLPACPTARVLVTSRRGLGKVVGVHVRLDMLDIEDSVGLLRARLGNERVDAEPEAAVGIVEMVGRLPLAVSLVAGRIHAEPQWSLADYWERLIDRTGALLLDDGVEIALTESYDRQPVNLRRLLRSISEHPGREIDAYSAAALADTDLRGAREGLADMQDAGLIQGLATGRYRIHDLVQIFAANRARDEDPPRNRQAALDRLFAYYRYGSARAMDAFAPHEADRRPPVEDPGLPIPDLSDRIAATTWLDAERSNLLATAAHATAHGAPAHTAALSRILFRYLDLAGITARPGCCTKRPATAKISPRAPMHWSVSQSSVSPRGTTGRQRTT